MTLKGIKLRLYPNRDQQLKIKLNFGYNRFVWNQMLAMMVERYQNNPEAKFLNAFALNNLLPALKTEYEWLKDAESTSLQSTNHDLVEAYKEFFRLHKGFPKFKSRKYPKQSYQTKSVNHNIKLVDNHHIQLPKLGKLKFKSGRKPVGKIKNVTIRLSATGKFYAVILVDTDIKPLAKTGNPVGIDLGVAD
ncbi:RNA-guided endonuclease TnpB family protein, partial [Secundilactobacillus hailunensis]